jgi:hypothetical protein
MARFYHPAMPVGVNRERRSGLPIFGTFDVAGDEVLSTARQTLRITL